MQNRLILLGIVLLSSGLVAATSANADPLRLILPTSNDGILRDDGPSFYQYTERTFNGVRSRPWEGGRYGFVRNPRKTSAGIIYTRFHEGVDIKPLYRSRNGEPLDTVRTIDDGFVVYVNTVERHSSYGKYVVVEHWWSGSPFYSLYAHLNAVHVQAGDRVTRGDRLGRIGYTGRGINKSRAHLHFEINVMLNQTFQDWFDGHYRAANRHDMYNGINLAGLDVADLYQSLQRDSTLTIEEFLKRQEAFFTVAIPNEGPLDLAYRYSWLESTDLPLQGDIASWELSLTASGLPVRVSPSTRVVSRPTVTTVGNGPVAYGLLTIGRVAGSGERYHLSSSGERYVSLISSVGPERPVASYQPSDEPEESTFLDQEDHGDRSRFGEDDYEQLRTW